MTGPANLPLLRLPMPLGGEEDALFWEALAQGVVAIPQCDACRKWTWPPQWRCGSCGSWAFDWIAVPPSGFVYSLARAHHTTLADMRAYTPFTTLLVTLPEAGGVRLMGLLDETNGPAEIGDAVAGTILRSTMQERPAIRWQRSVPSAMAG